MSDKSKDALEAPPRTLHDALFKRIFGDPQHAADELRAVLPSRIVRHIDWSTLEVGQASLVGKGFKQRHGDLIFHARLLDGRDAVVWLFFEHQSTVDPWMPLTMTERMTDFWARWRERNSGARRLPAIIPVVLYQGPGPWTAATSLGELMDLSDEAREDLKEHMLSCRLVLDDLGHAGDEEIAGRDMEAYPKLGLVVFKHGREEDLAEHLARRAAEIRALLAGEHGEVLWGVLMDYTWHVNPYVDREQLARRLRPLVGQEVEDAMMTYAEKLKQEGHDQGHREGQQEGQCKMLLRQLTRRFGVLPEAVEKRIARAEAAELQDWALRVLDARSLDEVFAPADQ
jgi:ribulose-5-phosphate 4-epimerase/fuculose-1-phosphate aldolase